MMTMNFDDDDDDVVVVVFDYYLKKNNDDDVLYDVVDTGMFPVMIWVIYLHLVIMLHHHRNHPPHKMKWVIQTIVDVSWRVSTWIRIGCHNDYHYQHHQQPSSH